MNRNILLTWLLLFAALPLLAQGLVMQSFEERPTDLTANTPGTIVIDQNGRKCALIKVESTLSDLTFEAGMLGVRKAEQHSGEWWVYVPDGVKRLSIFHPQLGVLRDKDLGQSVRQGRTYLLRLVAGRVDPIIYETPTSQYVLFVFEPQNAAVFLDGEMLQTSGGTATKLLRFGEYGYRVQAPDYLPEVGRVTISDPEQKHVVNVRLKPNFAQVTLIVDGNAEIWVNGQRKGQGRWQGNLGAGTYSLETRLPGHRPRTVTRDIEAGADPITIELDSPTPIYGVADINSAPAMADIYIDGQKVGQTPQRLSKLLVGTHQLRLSRQGYQDYTATITIREGQTESISTTLKQPAAITPAGGGGSTTSGDRQTFTVGNVSFQMVRVEGGTFQMGATSEQQNPYSDEKPVHQVTLSTYYIGETEVTQALWEAVMGSNPSDFKGGNKPVEMVSWDDCQTFISKLNQKTGQKFRLPTEAEWEYAARGGSKSRGYQYSGSNDIGSVAWYVINSGRATHDVKTKAPNELGLYDMSGNVWEWCQDWYTTYRSAAQTDPAVTTLGSASNRVCRGGSWRNYARSCRVANRGNFTSGDRDLNLGLRLASQ